MRNNCDGLQAALDRGTNGVETGEKENALVMKRKGRDFAIALVGCRVQVACIKLDRE